MCGLDPCCVREIPVSIAETVKLLLICQVLTLFSKTGSILFQLECSKKI